MIILLTLALWFAILSCLVLWRCERIATHELARWHAAYDAGRLQRSNQ